LPEQQLKPRAREVKAPIVNKQQAGEAKRSWCFYILFKYFQLCWQFVLWVGVILNQLDNSALLLYIYNE
jgi:hypothetical protein